MAQHHRQLLHNLEIETFKARTGDALGPATAGLGRGGEKGEIQSTAIVGAGPRAFEELVRAQRKGAPAPGARQTSSVSTLGTVRTVRHKEESEDSER